MNSLADTSKVAARLIGRTYDQANCWQLAREFYLAAFNLELKNYGSGDPGREVTKNLIYSDKGEFEEVSSPVVGDLIVIKIHGLESHIGIYIGPNQMLHSTKASGGVLEPIERWKAHIVGYYRHRANGQ